jgi:hypothetical protein
VLNVATQKAMGNTHKLSVITASKVFGAAITMVTMLGLRYFIPKTTSQLDDELNDRYFTPAIRKTQALFGAQAEDAPEIPLQETAASATHAARLEHRLREAPAALEL